MAGRGSRLRPHTLTIPKPLIPIAGKPIVQRLVEDIVKVCKEEVEEIAFIIGDFGKETEENLIKIAEGLGAKGSIYHQDEPLGTAHAIYCAEKSLSGNVVVAFADTLFRADFVLDSENDGVVWTKRVENPAAFGVVKKNDKGIITDFIEKPQEFVSDEAIIGIYYFKDGELLRNEIKHLLDHKIMEGGEYQITNALDNLKNKGKNFVSGTVNEWMDCGNKNVTVETNGRILGFVSDEEELISPKADIQNSEIIEPCFIAEGAVIRNSKIGPLVSVGAGTIIDNSTIKNTIIQENSEVLNATLDNSMIGNKAYFDGKFTTVSIGDFSRME